MKVEHLPNGTAVYVTVDGDMVDHIAYRHYGTRRGSSEAIFEANQNLSALGPILPAGVKIILPAFEPPPTVRQISLWD